MKYAYQINISGGPSDGTVITHPGVNTIEEIMEQFEMAWPFNMETGEKDPSAQLQLTVNLLHEW